MIVAISRFRPPPEHAERLVQQFEARTRAVDGHPGFLGLEVLRSFESVPEFLLVTRWADREALRAYMKSEDFRTVKAQSTAQDASFSMYELVAS
jgi:heme oxygenase (mycobilin-producing)